VRQRRQGEFVLTAHGVEGSLFYAIGADLRARLAQHDPCTVWLDLFPGVEAAALAAKLARARAGESLGTRLRKRLGLDGGRLALLQACLSKQAMAALAGDALALKALPLQITATRPLDEAISSAGGVCRRAVDERLMLRALPGVFCAGEMLDWEAPTGGYLLTACFASGRAAALGVLDWLARTRA
jgi:predicted flavoprotein YhiN